jgi:ribosome maturation factor RimP
MAPSQGDAVRLIVAPAVTAAGLVIEDVTVTSAGRRRVVKVVVDLPEDQTGGVPMEAVTVASQGVSAALDASETLGASPYTLEVTSPGAERLLTERRHWLRSRGRLVAVHLNDGSTVDGRLREVDDAGLTLDGAAPLPWTSIARGQVRLDFGGGS